MICSTAQGQARYALKNGTKIPYPGMGDLADWLDEGGSETPCGCWVEPDGECEHGEKSWMRIMGVI